MDGEVLAETVDQAYGPKEEELHFVRARACGLPRPRL